MRPAALFFFLKIVLAVRGLLFRVNTRIVFFYFLEKKATGILIRITSTLDCFASGGHFNDIKPSNP